MSMMKRHFEDVAYEYQKSHPEMEIEEVMEKIAEGDIVIDEEAE